MQLGPDQQKQPIRRYTNDPAAYLLFREGCYHWTQGRPESLELAIKQFQEAIDKDPKFALAWAWKSHAYIGLSNFRSFEENWARAKESAGQALLIDDNLAEGHVVLGLRLLFYQHDWRQAQMEFRRALELDPKNSGARHLYGYCLGATGKLKEALVEIEQAVREDPLSLTASSALVRAYLWTKRYKDAVDQSHKELQISSTRLMPRGNLGLACAYLSRYDEAVTALQEGLKLSKDHPYLLGFLGYTYAQSGKRAEAEEILKRLQEQPSQRAHRAYALATVYTGLGDKDQAMHWLNESRNNHDLWIIFLKVDPQWESLRSHPRYSELLQRMGLAD